MFKQGGKAANPYFAKNKTNPLLFAVLHFAGEVRYTVTNFLDKNRDTLSDTAKEAMRSSSNHMISDLFQEPEAAGGGGSKKKMGLGGQFRGQLIGLITGLKPKESHFCRCVKPNYAKKPGIFESPLTLGQLRNAGVFEAIGIRKSGYAYRASHQAFSGYYAILVDDLKKQMDAGEKTAKEAAGIILEQATANKLFARELWQIGKSKVFMKTNDMNVLLDRQRGVKCAVFAVKIQALARGVLYRLKYCAEQYAAIAAKKAKKAEEERLRLEALGAAAKMSMAVILTQRHARGFLVRRAMRSVAQLLKLRAALAKKDMPTVVKLIAKIDNSSPPPPV